jgi:hypothetical protein
MRKAKVLRSYQRKSDTALSEFALHVKTEMDGNALFPTPAIAAGVMEDAANDFNTAIGNAIDGSKADTVAKNVARTALILKLDAQADYVEGIANGDVGKILSSGFDATKTTITSSPLATPNINSVRNHASGKLKLIITAIKNASGYEVQASVGSGAWVTVATPASTRLMIVEGLTPGTLYNLRVRAIGGSTGHSEWSDVVGHMSL